MLKFHQKKFLHRSQESPTRKIDNLGLCCGVIETTTHTCSHTLIVIVENVPMKRPAPKAVTPSIEHSLLALINSSIGRLLSYISRSLTATISNKGIPHIEGVCPYIRKKKQNWSLQQHWYKETRGVDMGMYVYVCTEDRTPTVSR